LTKLWMMAIVPLSANVKPPRSGNCSFVSLLDPSRFCNSFGRGGNHGKSSDSDHMPGFVRRLRRLPPLRRKLMGALENESGRCQRPLGRRYEWHRPLGFRVLHSPRRS
jgi:hypothetical protein